MDNPSGTCFVCGRGPVAADPAIEEEFYPGLWCHFYCLNSPDGMAWREQRTASDAGYARYLRLMSIGLPTVCPSCGGACCLSAKARGMGAGSWEACCTACSNFTTLSGYSHKREFDAIMAAEQTMLFDEHSNAWRGVMIEIAKTADGMLTKRTCVCGAQFSVVAKPRCPRCRTVLMDSFFHHAYIPGPIPGH